MKVLANDGLSPEGISILMEAGFEVSTDKIDQSLLADHINQEGIEILLVRSATTARKELIDACPGLRLIGRGGVGMDNIDVKYAREKGLKVINTPAASSQSVAELVMGHLFGLCRFLHDSNRQLPVNGTTEFAQLKKKYAKGIELRGKTIGIIGFGRIGQSVAKYALGMGMKVLAFDAVHMTKEIYLEFANISPVKITVETCSMEEILRDSDFITIHTPAQADGRPVIGREEFQKMKDGVILVNASRGGIIDEKELIEALNNGKVASAALDVFRNEPNPDPALLTHPQLSVTPHTGAATMEAQERVSKELASQIIDTFQPA